MRDKLRDIFEKLIIDHYWDSLNTEKEIIIKHFIEGILPLAHDQIIESFREDKELESCDCKVAKFPITPKSKLEMCIKCGRLTKVESPKQKRR